MSRERGALFPETAGFSRAFLQNLPPHLLEEGWLTSPPVLRHERRANAWRDPWSEKTLRSESLITAEESVILEQIEQRFQGLWEELTEIVRPPSLPVKLYLDDCISFIREKQNELDSQQELPDQERRIRAAGLATLVFRLATGTQPYLMQTLALWRSLEAYKQAKKGINQGSVLEVPAGDGKSYATIPLLILALRFLEAKPPSAGLTNPPIYVHTVDPYLCQRDYDNFKKMAILAGISLGHLVSPYHGKSFANGREKRWETRKEVLKQNVVFGLWSNFGHAFQAEMWKEEPAFSPHAITLVDEIDHILQDEEPTPLVILPTEIPSLGVLISELHAGLRKELGKNFFRSKRYQEFVQATLQCFPQLGIEANDLADKKMRETARIATLIIFLYSRIFEIYNLHKKDPSLGLIEEKKGFFNLTEKGHFLLRYYFWQTFYQRGRQSQDDFLALDRAEPDLLPQKLLAGQKIEGISALDFTLDPEGALVVVSLEPEDKIEVLKPIGPQRVSIVITYKDGQISHPLSISFNDYQRIAASQREKPLNQETSGRLIQAICTALSLQEKVHYFVENGQIKLISRITGYPYENREFSSLVQLILRLKHNLPLTITDEQVQVKRLIPLGTHYQDFLTVQGFYMSFCGPKIGFTASATPAAQRLKEIYDLETIVIPPQFKEKRQELSPLAFALTPWRSLIEEYVNPSQSTLIITNSIEEAQIAFEAARLFAQAHSQKRPQAAPIEVKLHTALNAQEAKNIFAKQGPKIIVSAKTAGRGVEAHFNLVIYQCPQTKRLEKQRKCRTGRRGKPGNTLRIINPNDELFAILPERRREKLIQLTRQRQHAKPSLREQMTKQMAKEAANAQKRWEEDARKQASYLKVFERPLLIARKILLQANKEQKDKAKKLWLNFLDVINQRWEIYCASVFLAKRAEGGTWEQIVETEFEQFFGFKFQ